MRAVLCRRHGGLETLSLENVPSPPMISGGVRIAVAAAGLNFADLLAIKGTYQEKRQPPFIPGFEVAGVVSEIAADVTSCQVGDRVLAVTDYGGFAQEVVARAEDVFRLPPSMSNDVAAGFPIAYGTSHFGLIDRCSLQKGEIVLVHGASGGVGLTAVEIAAQAGAQVIATAGDADKQAVVRAAGAHHILDYRHEDIVARVKELTNGRGVDIVYDPVGGDLFDASLRCSAPDGRLLSVGFASGRVPQIPANILLVKNLTVIGYYWGAYRRIAPQRLRQSMMIALDWFAQGRLKPQICESFDLEEIVRGLERLRDRHVKGKVVVTVTR